MKSLAFAFASLLAGCAANPALEAQQGERSEVALAGALEGLVAGPPQRCVSTTRLGGNRGFGGDAILFTGTGGTAFLNRTRGGCEGLTEFRALVTRPGGTQLCSGDLVTVVDTGTGSYHGSCVLGDFTPYRRGQG